ncbi:metallophosphoesterase [Nocardia gamkensis]|uniref:metallophosphoesterase n=1 Tax=Nocardia gamkensis TaxID=352869 RepID=UPI0033C2AC30
MVVKSVLVGVAVLVLVGVVVLTVVGAHWYIWRRLVRDTTAAGSRARRVGTAIVLAGPSLLLGATVSELASAPFAVVRIIAWPGYLWGALFVYLLLALAVGEPIRILALRWFDRGRAGPNRESAAGIDSVPKSSGGSGSEEASSGRSGSVSESLMGSGSGQSSAAGSGSASASAVGSGSGRASAVGSGSASKSLVGSGSGQASVVESGSVSASAVGSGSGQASVVGSGSASESLVRSGSGRASAAGSDSASKSPAEHGSARESSTGAGSALESPPDTAAPGESPKTRLPRRVFVARVVSGAAVAAAAATVGVGAYGVLDGPSVKRVAVPLAKLPRRADGFRIAVVSDVHLGPILGRGFAQRVVRSVNDTQPDLIAVVGDLVDGSVEHLRSAVEPLAGLRARHGAFFVTGNHEYFSGAEQWVEHVQELGMHLLANARTELPGFDLAGVNDVQGERIGQGPDFGKALGDRDRARTAVLLAHQPVLIEDAVAHGVDLQLSGHTHGGQLWPGNYLAGLANPTVAGLERYGDTQLYVSRGAGAWGPPVRVGAPSDITVVELVSLQA